MGSAEMDDVGVFEDKQQGEDEGLERFPGQVKDDQVEQQGADDGEQGGWQADAGKVIALGDGAGVEFFDLGNKVGVEMGIPVAGGDAAQIHEHEGERRVRRILRRGVFITFCSGDVVGFVPEGMGRVVEITDEVKTGEDDNEQAQDPAQGLVIGVPQLVGQCLDEGRGFGAGSHRRRKRGHVSLLHSALDLRSGRIRRSPYAAIRCDAPVPRRCIAAFMWG